MRLRNTGTTRRRPHRIGEPSCGIQGRDPVRGPAARDGHGGAFRRSLAGMAFPDTGLDGIQPEMERETRGTE
jgi:hypothetical protein